MKYQRQFVQDAIVPTITLLLDKRAALSITDKQGLKSRTKKIAVKYHHVKHVRFGSVIHLDNLPTLDKIADILTKTVQRHVLYRLIKLLVFLCSYGVLQVIIRRVDEQNQVYYTKCVGE